jgi:hypothetical protein
MCAGDWLDGADAKFRRIAALLRGDEPAKPDRYVVIAEEITSAANIVSHGGYYELDIEAVEAVLRRHFEPPARVIQAARCLKDGSPKGGSAELCADFILKGDQCLALNGSR